MTKKGKRKPKKAESKMETAAESEQTSYDVQKAEELAEVKTESYEPIGEDAALIEKAPSEEPEEEKPVDVEVTDETTALTEKSADVDPEDLTTKEPSQSLKGRFLMFFERKKQPPQQNEDEPAAVVESQQNGDTPHNTPAEAAEPVQTTTTKKRFLPPIKIKNPFMKKSESATPIAPEENTENVENHTEPVAEADQKDGTEATEVPPPLAENGEDKKEAEVNEEKPKITSRISSALSSITLPNFSGLVGKLKRAPGNPDDIELGNGKKAGLASMETLDDSTRDSDAVDKSTPEKTEAKATDDEVPPLEKGPSVWETIGETIRAYSCSIDDIALFIGLLVFLILVALILTFTFVGSSKPLKIAPIRDGKVVTVTSCGKVEGVVEDSAVAFRGIPYAQSPIGLRRFESARPLDNIKYCWNGTLEAHSPTDECMQTDKDGKVVGSEDCLTLDVVTSQVRNYNLLPVIVLIGAESFNGGSPGILKPSARFARIRDVVYVRPKFRLNVFGFLALEPLSKSARTSGNYALSDIIVALEWIQTNIHNFGGDPTQVTLLGHRAGATLVTALASSAKASKLFDRAWASSPSAVLPGKKFDELEQQNDQYFNNFRDCVNKTCWETQDAKLLINKTPQSWKINYADSLPKIGEKFESMHQFLGIDGVILKKHPFDSWKGIPNLSSKLIIGTTQHAAYDREESSTISSEGIFSLVNDSKIGEANLTRQALDLYGENEAGLKQMISDIRTVCPLLSMARTYKIPFYIVTQTRGEKKLADVSFDIEGIFARFDIEESPQRRYMDSIRAFFFYYVYHGKAKEYSPNHPILEVGQDVEGIADYPNCDFWISNKFVPQYAAI